ncbi:MAG TPA: dihydroneopterin aldolase [Acidimicrobiales bacterium]|nr:dihydroneopterin aldolase [Acidimicrobiales bacterium]
MNDRIELRGLRVTTIVGVNPEERDRAQPLELDLDVMTDLRAAGHSDRLEDTINYGALTLVAVTAADGPGPLLLEHMAQSVATAVLQFDARIDAVRVTVRKLRPPIPVDVATAAVTILRTREQ